MKIINERDAIFDPFGPDEISRCENMKRETERKQTPGTDLKSTFSSLLPRRFVCRTQNLNEQRPASEIIFISSGKARKKDPLTNTCKTEMIIIKFALPRAQRSANDFFNNRGNAEQVELIIIRSSPHETLKEISCQNRQ